MDKPMNCNQLHQVFDSMVKTGRRLALGCVPDCTNFKTIDLGYESYSHFNKKNYVDCLQKDKILDTYISDHWGDYYSEYGMGLEQDLIGDFKHGGYFYKYHMTPPTHTDYDFYGYFVVLTQSEFEISFSLSN